MLAGLRTRGFDCLLDRLLCLLPIKPTSSSDLRTVVNAKHHYNYFEVARLFFIRNPFFLFVCFLSLSTCASLLPFHPIGAVHETRTARPADILG